MPAMTTAENVVPMPLFSISAAAFLNTTLLALRTDCSMLAGDGGALFSQAAVGFEKRFRGQLGGDVAGLVPAHAVGDDEQVFIVGYLFVQEKILIGGAHLADVALGEKMDVHPAPLNGAPAHAVTGHVSFRIIPFASCWSPGRKNSWPASVFLY